jgi:hypothetical protein
MSTTKHFIISDKEGLDLRGTVEKNKATIQYGKVRVSLELDEELEGLLVSDHSELGDGRGIEYTKIKDVFDIPILLTMMQMAGLNISSTTTIGMVEKVSTIYKEST